MICDDMKADKKRNNLIFIPILDRGKKAMSQGTPSKIGVKIRVRYKFSGKAVASLS